LKLYAENGVNAVIRNIDQQFEICIDISNQSRKSVVLMVLREAPNHKNYKEFFLYSKSLSIFRTAGERNHTSDNEN